MALPVTIPNTFANATASIPLSQLDTNFTTLANAVNGISDGSETLANASVTVLTAGTVDINGGAIDGTTVGTSNAAAGSFTTLNTSGAVVFNDAGADVDFRVESDTVENALFVDGATGNVGIGEGSPLNLLSLKYGATDFGASILVNNTSSASGSTASIKFVNNSSATGLVVGKHASGFADSNLAFINQETNAPLAIFTNNTERMRITSAGAVAIGTTSPNTTFSVNGTMELASGVHTWVNSVGAAPNAAATNYASYGHSVTGRGMSSGGSINASGTDYAEYMTKAGDFELAKGDICGINADGKLTNVFADAVAFLVKSTNPSYVGGDIWGNENAVGKRPVKPFQRAAEVDEEGNETQAAETDEDFAARQAQYETDLAEFEAKLEVERQKVDRMAFSGQVPVNVTGATAGQYIVPVESNGGITGVAVNEADMTLAQYMKAVGKVIAIEADGRAKIIVKVA